MRAMAICIEDLDDKPEGTPFTSCTVLDGSRPGLTLGPGGELRWESDEAPALQLFVSLDERLVLIRPAGAGGVVMHRGSRSLEVPEGKPVVLLDQDCFDLAGRRFRIHVHGEAPAITPPTPVALEQEGDQGSTLGSVARAAATALALGAAVGASACKTVEVREKPPVVAPAQVDKGPATPDAGPDTRPTPDTRRSPEAKPIEVRQAPPVIAMPPKPPEPPPKPAPSKSTDKK